MGKQQKPKPEAKVVTYAARRNGKKPKQNPKQNPRPTGRTTGGYSPAALARREARRAPLTFDGLLGGLPGGSGNLSSL